MTNNSLIQQLQERGLISQITDEKALVELLSKKPINLYCGFDPTADSLHLGHLVPLLCMKRFQMAGHRPVVLVGGATGLIGDPSFKATERKLNTIEIVEKWVNKIKCQISTFLDFDCGKNSAIVTNNYDWFSTMNVLTFLRDIGKHFSINQMINKEAVKQRLNRNNSGISFAEFSYNLLQGYDFAWLHEQYDVSLQIGGSDQWGNIISGVNLTRRLYKNTVYGLTVPLIIKADGTKVGKTNDNSVWLDSSKTSPYRFYQFWINTTDDDVYRFLKFFTFLDLTTINTLEDKNYSNHQKLRAQYILAENITRMVHGEQGLAAAKRITACLFTKSGNALTKLTEDDFIQLTLDGMPTIEIDKGTDLKQALITASLVSSKRQAHNLISSNAISINGEKQVTTEYVFRDIDKLYGRYTLLRRGKKNYCLLRWQR